MWMQKIILEKHHYFLLMAQVIFNEFVVNTDSYQFIWSGDGKVAELLIENGAHINAVNYDGMTILQSAAANGNSEDELGKNQFPQINSYSCRQFSFG